MEILLFRTNLVVLFSFIVSLFLMIIDDFVRNIIWDEALSQLKQDDSMNQYSCENEENRGVETIIKLLLI